MSVVKAINSLNTNKIEYVAKEIPNGISLQFGLRYFDEKGEVKQAVAINAADQLTIQLGKNSQEVTSEGLDKYLQDVVAFRQKQVELEESLAKILL